MKNAMHMGNYLLDGFRKALDGIDGIKDIRGRGLMLAIELDRDCAACVQMALDQGLLINVAGGNRIRLLPPLIINETQADQIIDTVSTVISMFLSESSGETE